MDFSDLEDLTPDGKIKGATKAPTKHTKRRFECTSCGGTGKWRAGRANYRGNDKCNACQGQGFFVTSPAERQRRSERRVNRKAETLATGQAANATHGDGFLLTWLTEIATWNEFAASMMEQHGKGRAWSEKQVAACRRMYTKMEEKKAARAKQDEDRPAVDLGPIKVMFDAAVDSGYKAPKYRAEGLIISRAKDSSANPGALYVKTEGDEYMGKVLDGVFKPAGSGEAAIGALLAIAADPEGAAVAYGRRTGRCACCGRELTKHESIDRGIGPVCAERWGF